MSGQTTAREPHPSIDIPHISTSPRQPFELVQKRPVNSISCSLQVFYILAMLKIINQILVLLNMYRLITWWKFGWKIIEIDNNSDIGTVKYVSFDNVVEFWLKNHSNWMSSPQSVLKNYMWPLHKLLSCLM